MSAKSPARGDDRCDLRAATCWPLVFACGGVLVAAGALGLWAAGASRSPEPATRTAPVRPAAVQVERTERINRAPLRTEASRPAFVEKHPPAQPVELSEEKLLQSLLAQSRELDLDRVEGTGRRLVVGSSRSEVNHTRLL